MIYPAGGEIFIPCYGDPYTITMGFYLAILINNYSLILKAAPGMNFKIFLESHLYYLS